MTPVSIIVATHARRDELLATLESFGDLALPSDCRCELIIVENGSASDLRDAMGRLEQRGISVRHFKETFANKSRALNLAIARATGRILVFTDDDVRVPREWLIELCTPIVRGEGNVVVGGSRLAPNLRRDWMTRYHRAFLASTEHLAENPSEFAGINVAIARCAWDRVGAFDEELGGGGLGNCEDTLLARQLRQLGETFVSRCHVHVEHHPMPSRLSYGSWVKAAGTQGRSTAYLDHHWYHRRTRFRAVQLAFFRAKLFLRLLRAPHRSPDTEGIPAWELSYRVDIARLEQESIEQRRPRNYDRLGSRKLGRAPLPLSHA